MDEILSDGQDDSLANLSSMLLLTHISSEPSDTEELLTDLIVGHEGWARR